MSGTKRGEVAVLLVLFLLIIVGAVFFLGKEGITGAVVGVDEGNLSLPIDDFVARDKSPEEMMNNSMNSSDYSDNLIIELSNISNMSINLPLFVKDNLIISDANGSQCGTVNTNILNLVSNITSTVTCFTINVSNASIDCHGYSIIGSGVGRAISTNQNNTWIHNCNIINFSDGVNANGQFNAYINNITIENSTFSSDGSSSFTAAVDLSYVNNVTIKNSTFTNNYYGVLIQAGDGGLITINKNIFYGNNYSVSIWPLLNVTIFANNFTANRIGIEFLAVSSTATNVSNNSFINNNYGILQEGNKIIIAENNWWGSDNCTNISQTIFSDSSYSNVSTVDYDPYLNSSGGSANCPSTYCGMNLFISLNLTNNLTGCPKDGLNIFNDSVILNCQGYSLSGNINNNGTAINIFGKSAVTVKNCNLLSFSRGIFANGAEGIVISNNTLFNYSDYGVRSTANSLIFNNSFLYGRSTTFYMDSSLLPSAALYISSSGSNITQNNFTGNPTAIFVAAATSNFQSNYFRNNSIGYHIQSLVDNFFDDQLVGSQTAILINKTGNARNNFFYNTSFENNTLDLNYASGTPGNVTFINSSANVDKISVYSSGTAYFRRYVDVNVTNSSISALNGVTIEAYDSTATLRDSQSSSSITRLTLLEFYQIGNINYYVTPYYTIYAKMNGYLQNSTIINIYNQTYTKVNLSLTYFTCGLNVTSDFTFAQNMSCPNTGLFVSADNISINGNNYFLIGVNANKGINLDSKRNVVIHDLAVTNFTQGLYLEYTNNSIFYNLKIINNTIGLIFNNSNNNTVHSSTIANNSLVNVSLTSTLQTNNSLTNLSINPDIINVSDSARVFRRWFVDVNSTFNGGSLLSNANLYGYFNNTGINNSGVLDDYVTTSGSGMGRLSLAEWIKNSTQTVYLTPHNITLSFTFQGINSINSTFINISQSNSTNISLGLNLSCTTPTENINYISSSTTFCPGTYSVDQIRINGNNIVLTCVNTIIQKKLGSSEDAGIYIYGLSHILIDSCNVNNFYDDVQISGSSTNVTLNRVNLTSRSHSPLISCSSSNLVEVRNSYLGDHTAIQFAGCSSSIIKNNTFTGDEESIVLYDSYDNLIYNNTIGGSVGIQLITTAPSRNNTIYSNNFSSTSSYVQSVTDISYVNYFNITSNGYALGNTYSNYCKKGKDLNNDGYADAVSTSGNDWPYNATYFSTFTGVGTDFGPKMFDCPPTTVHLGSSTSSLSSTALSSDGSAPPAAPTAPAPPSAPSSAGSSAPYSPVQVKHYLKTSNLQTKTSDGITQVTFTLENTGTQPMQLFPNILQEVDDPFFIVTRKTLGGENSKFTNIAHLSYSDTPVAGRLLKATIVNPADIVLQPGEKTEKTIEIKEGLAIPRQLKIQFTTLGESVLEKEVKVEKKVVSGTAVDVDTQNNVMDVYAVLVPEKALMQTNDKKDNGITGAVVGVANDHSQTYYLELSMNDPKTNTTAFADLYGPYNLKQGQSFIFAQQVKYDPLFYNSNFNVQTKIIKAGQIVVKNELPVELGIRTNLNSSFIDKGLWIFLIFIVILSIVISIIIYQKR